MRDYDELVRLITAGYSISQKVTDLAQGIAIDLGSGTGIGASIISNLSEVTKIYAVEYSEQFVLKIMPLVFLSFKTQTEKIIRVVGDFNKLKLPDESVSMIVEIDSLHHSEDLSVTLNECFRVLKPGGVIISIDRAWPNYYSNDQLETLLDKEYDEQYKELHGIDPKKTYRRRDYGEHEYRTKDWIKYYQDSEFTTFVFSQKHLPFLNSLLLKVLPGFSISVGIAGFLAKLGIRNLFLYGFNPTRKLFIAVKSPITDYI